MGDGHDDLVRARYRQRPEQERIRNREQRGVRADAERERQNHRRGKSWHLSQATDRQYEIVQLKGADAHKATHKRDSSMPD